MPPANGRGRRRLLTALTALVAATLTVAASELAVSLLDPEPSYRRWRERSLTFLYDDDVDWKLEPRAYDWGQVNAEFYRGEALAARKPPGVFRIVLLGGSAAFDLFKRDDDTWAAQLGRRLARIWHRRVEVLNAGTPGYSSWQSLRLLRTRLIDRDPDLVLVYHLYNDSHAFRFGDREEIERGWRLNGRANHIGWVAHPSLLLDGVAARLLPRTTDWLRMLAVRRLLRRRLAENDAFWRDETLGSKVNPVGMGFFEENLEAIAALGGSRRVPVGLITQALLLRSDSPPRVRRLARYENKGLDHEELCRANAEALERVRALCRRRGDAFLIEAYDRVPPTLDDFSDEVHLTALGSERLAAIVADAVADHFAGGRTGE